MDIETLRRETEADHHAVEDALPLMGLDLDTATYVDCLCRLYGVIAAWEENAFSLAPDWLHAKLVMRDRRFLLDRDLAWFGVEAPPGRATLPVMSDLPGLLGAMYVMEGSTLGGQLIARHVETALSLAQGHGDAFFRGHGTQTGPLWKEFCEMLKTRVSDDQTDQVVASAKAMFATFGWWMQGKPVSDGR